MKLEKICEACQKIFQVSRKDQKGRFCSKECTRKLLRKDQLKKHFEYLAQETEEQKISWLKEHYKKFVIKNQDGCWGWNGCLMHGYANFNHRGKIIKAHRASWIIHNGKIPDEMFVLHKCDVRSCSNPQHLFLGDHTDNMRDMAFKGRTMVQYGEKNPASVLTENDVIKIKELLKMGVSMPRISSDFKVNKNTIANIKYGKTWKRVT